MILKVLVFLALAPLVIAAAQDQSGESGQGEQSAFAFQEVGQQIYTSNCAACHQSSGEGIEGVYPTLVSSDIVTGDAESVVHILLNGRGGMPSFAADLSNEEIAAVISYVRTSWGNEAEVVTPEMVAEGSGSKRNRRGVLGRQIKERG